MSREAAIAALMGEEAPSETVQEVVGEAPASPEAAEAATEAKEEAAPPAKSSEEVRAEILQAIQARREARVKRPTPQDTGLSEAEQLRAELLRERRVNQDLAKKAEAAELIASGQPRRALELLGKDLNQFGGELADESLASANRQQQELLARLDRLEKERQAEIAERQAAERAATRRQVLKDRLEKSGLSKSEELKLVRALNDNPEALLSNLERWFPQDDEPEPEDILDMARLVEQSTRAEVEKIVKAGALDSMLKAAGWTPPASAAKSEPVAASKVPNGASRSGTGVDSEISYSEARKKAIQLLVEGTGS